MDNKFYPLDCDDDVILLNEDTFKISRLKELANQDIKNKVNNNIYNQKTQILGDNITNVLSQLSIGAVTIKLSVQYNSVIDCQLLRIGAKGWQKGKLKIEGNLIGEEVYLEFCPDQPKEPESPLDDIRKMLKDEQ